MARLVLICLIAMVLEADTSLRRLQENFKRYLLEPSQSALYLKRGRRALEQWDLSSSHVFSSYLDLSSGKLLQATLAGIEDLLKLEQTPKNPYYHSPTLQLQIVQALEVVARYYVVGGLERGNWWHYEIGIPKLLNEILVLGATFIPTALRAKLLSAQTYYQPDARYSGLSAGARVSSNPKPRLSQGANRVDSAFISLIRGALENDTAQIQQALDALRPVSQIVDHGDGFYADGSFIQHQHVPSNGSYGLVLLRGLALFMWVLDHTRFMQADLISPSLYASVLKSYPYFLIQGGLNASICGRSISRDREDDFSRASSLIFALAILAQHAPPPYKIPLQQLIKDNLKFHPTIKHTFIKQALEQIAKSDLAPLRLDSVRIFGAMDRVVGGNIVLAMHSKRILNYERMNGENLKGFDTSDGMTYIYGRDARAFIDYWPLVDPFKLPGTTENTTQEPPSKGKLSSQTWVGGVSNGHYGFVGMDFRSGDLRAKKSYLFLDGVLLALGNVHSPKQAITTIDNRKINPTDHISVEANGKPLSALATLSKRGDFFNFTNPTKRFNIGYILMQDLRVSVQEVLRSGSYAQIGGKSPLVLRAPFLQALITHTTPQATYAYLVLPNFSKAQVETYPIDDIVILAQKDSYHAVRVNSKHLLAINKYQHGGLKIANLYLTDALSLLEITTPKGLQLSVADPSQRAQPTTIIIDGKYALAQPSPSVQVAHKGDRTLLNLQPPALGASLVLDLLKL
ncbi:polysaccharide lyase family 8 super-sandwich domain-containing protein [Helicobacter sp. L8]|uniref:polysaccharide lyase family 8 super-sandwich domain-containing protein n=1 Tax=Helicobacter sp. L8 TaxID=2316078 RepID=UPI000EABA8F0|nr:polysaccharide lyase family 8 super-sandwich domain-containing protein [Helicobacter sp. L8]